MKITIDTHHSSREEVQELKEYLEEKCWDFQTNEKSEPNFILGDNKINGITLNEKIRDEEMHEYYICHRESFLEELMRWIGEARQDKQLMKDDLEMLMQVEDEYILSSNSTNSYLYQGCSEFDEKCQELIELNEEIN